MNHTQGEMRIIGYRARGRRGTPEQRLWYHVIAGRMLAMVRR